MVTIFLKIGDSLVEKITFPMPSFISVKSGVTRIETKERFIKDKAKYLKERWKYQIEEEGSYEIYIQINSKMKITNLE